jgi:predicted acyltransferase
VQRNGRRLRSVGLLVATGVACATIGLAWDSVLPINKRLWTSSLAMFSGGIAMMAFAACLWSVDVAAPRRWARPCEVIGVNAITAYIASHVFAHVLSKHLSQNSRNAQLCGSSGIGS